MRMAQKYVPLTPATTSAFRRLFAENRLMGPFENAVSLLKFARGDTFRNLVAQFTLNVYSTLHDIFQGEAEEGRLREMVEAFFQRPLFSATLSDEIIASVADFGLRANKEYFLRTLSDTPADVFLTALLCAGHQRHVSFVETFWVFFQSYAEGWLPLDELRLDVLLAGSRVEAFAALAAEKPQALYRAFMDASKHGRPSTVLPKMRLHLLASLRAEAVDARTARRLSAWGDKVRHVFWHVRELEEHPEFGEAFVLDPKEFAPGMAAETTGAGGRRA